MVKSPSDPRTYHRSEFRRWIGAIEFGRALVFQLAVLGVVMALVAEVQLGPLRAERAQLLEQFPADPPHQTAGLLPVPEQSALPTIRIGASPRDLAVLDRATREGDPKLGTAPGGDRPFVRATYVDESGVSQIARIRYRGISPWHRQASKPSLRVKLRKEDIQLGHREIELQRPESALALGNWLPDQLARRVGILSMLLDHVRVFVNGRYYGVYDRNIRPGESAVVANRRMPGTLFKGDNFEQDLWAGPAAWLQDNPTPETVAIFERVLALLRAPPSAATLNELGARLDLESLFRWLSLCIITGSVHADDVHNHLLYVASERGKVEFAAWDMNGYGTFATPDVPVDVVRNPFQRVVMLQPLWLHRRNLVLAELLKGDLSAEHEIAIARAELSRMLPDLAADPYGASVERLHLPRSKNDSGFGLVPSPPSNLGAQQARIEAWIRKREATILEYLADARVAVDKSADRVGASRVTVYGAVAVRVRHRDRKHRDGGDEQVLFPGRAADPAHFASRPFNDTPLMVDYAPPAAMTYTVDGNPDDLAFENAVTGAVVSAERALPEGVSVSSVSLRPEALLEHHETRDIVLGPGACELDSDLMVQREQTLIIRAGTRVELFPGVSIVSRGRVLVEGTEREPVEIVPLRAGMPWGTFGLTGPGTQGSRLRYMHVHGGGSKSDGYVTFKGMFNVYECPDAVIDHCTFGRNESGDDAVNIASSHFVVKDSTWLDARSDGLDVDMGQGTIVGCSFERSGNDGLDLMTSQVVVQGSRLVGNLDKGISVGEETQIIVCDSTFSRNHIGVEVKDGSHALLAGVTFRQNGVGWHSYRKKWMYRVAGHGLLLDSTFAEDERADTELDAMSDLVAVRTRMAEPDSKRLRRAESPPPEWGRWLETLELLRSDGAGGKLCAGSVP